MTEKPLILVSNDDGINAQGIGVLTRLMCALADVKDEYDYILIDCSPTWDSSP